jgi:hypothetical protein
MADLILQEAYHDHLADALTLSLTLAPGAGDHLHSADAVIVRLSWHLSTLQDDGKSYPLLPTLLLDAQTGERIDLDAMLPGVKPGSMRSGARTDPVAKLPVLELAATVQAGAVGRVDKRLPATSMAGRFGARCDELLLPALELSITITGDRWGRLDRTLPGLTITATGSTPVLATLAKDLPALEISASASRLHSGRLDRSLPALKLTASALSGAFGALQATLPALELTTDAGLYGDQLSLEAKLPALVAAAIATGTHGGQSGSIVNADRFTGYVLRYER